MKTSYVVRCKFCKRSVVVMAYGLEEAAAKFDIFDACGCHNPSAEYVREGELDKPIKKKESKK